MVSERGFTLIEVMIVVAIVAILASIAYPSYQDSVAKGRRSDAMSALQGLAQAMERHYTNTGSYTAAASSGNDTGAPAIFSTKSPIDGAATYYNLVITAATANSYTIQAQPAGVQVGDGYIQLQSTGERAWARSGGSSFAATDGCWERSC